MSATLPECDAFAHDPPDEAVAAAECARDGRLRFLDLHEVELEHCPICVEPLRGADACPVHGAPVVAS